MFKNFGKITLGALVAIATLSGCGSSENTKETAAQATQKLIVGATPEPHAVILEQIKPLLAKDGLEITIKEFTDYVTPNKSLNDGSLDANFFQHKPYLDSFNSEHKTNLVSVAGIHIEPMGVYSKKIKSLEELKSGDSISRFKHFIFCICY